MKAVVGRFLASGMTMEAVEWMSPSEISKGCCKAEAIGRNKYAD